MLEAALVACSGSGSRPVVTVSPRTALYDRPLSISVTGLPAGKPLILRLSTRDKTGTTWSSSAVFTADSRGQVSTGQAPTSGDYTGANPMGLVETLGPGHSTGTTASGVVLEGGGAFQADQAARADGWLKLLQQFLARLTPG